METMIYKWLERELTDRKRIQTLNKLSFDGSRDLAEMELTGSKMIKKKILSSTKLEGCEDLAKRCH